MDSQTLTVVIAVGIIFLLIGGAMLALRRSETRVADTAIAVSSRRRRGNFAVDLYQLGTDRPRIAEHGVVWLDDENRARAGGELWVELHPRFEPTTVSFLPRVDGAVDPAVFGERNIRLSADEGGAAWMRWAAGSDTSDFESLVILWTVEQRRRGLSPATLRGSEADKWIDHFQKPASEAPELPRAVFNPLRLLSGWARLGLNSATSGAKSAPDDSDRPAYSPLIGGRAWLTWILSGLLVVILGLIVLDLVGIRRFIPLSSDYDWLAFVGAVIGGIVGGLVTFGGVYLTLQHANQSELRRQDAEDLRNRLSILPLFEFSVSYDPKDFDNSSGQLAEEPGMPIYSIDGATWGTSGAMRFAHDLIVRNVGLGHALLKTVIVDIRDNRGQPVQKENLGFPNFLVKSDSSRHLRMYFVAARNNPRFEDPRQFGFQIMFTLHYDDLLGNGYSQVVHTTIAKGLYPDEDPVTGGSPFASLSHAEPPARRDTN